MSNIYCCQLDAASWLSHRRGNPPGETVGVLEDYQEWMQVMNSLAADAQMDSPYGRH